MFVIGTTLLFAAVIASWDSSINKMTSNMEYSLLITLTNIWSELEKVLFIEVFCGTTYYRQTQFNTDLYKYSSFTVTTDYIDSTQISMMIFYSSMSYDYLEEYIPHTWKDVLGKNWITCWDSWSKDQGGLGTIGNRICLALPIE